MQTLTFVTGIADAVGYLALDKVFTGNMTGNVVILGMALGATDDLPILGPAVALIAFMLGAVVGGRVLRDATGPWPRELTDLLLAVSAALWMAMSGLAFLAIDESFTAAGIAAVIAAAMGAQAAAARFVAVKDVTTVVVTSTITGLAADSWLGGRNSQPWMRRLTAVVVIGAGALTGALSLKFGTWYGMALAATISTVIAVAAGVVEPMIAVHTEA